MVQTECVENDSKEISPAGLAESLCAPPSPGSFQNFVFYFQILVFVFKVWFSSVWEVGESRIFSMPNFKMWLSIFKIWVASVGDLGIRGDGNFDYDFFSISASVNDTGKISRPCIRSHPICPCVENDTKEISPAGLAESLCAPPSPRSLQNLVFYFQTLVFFFKMLVY